MLRKRGDLRVDFLQATYAPRTHLLSLDASEVELPFELTNEELDCAGI